MTSWRVMGWVLLLAIVSGCGASDGQAERVAKRGQALDVPGFAPVPCCSKDPKKQGYCHAPVDAADAKSTWNGTKVDLLAADAFAECAVEQAGAEPNSDPEWTVGNEIATDKYLAYLVGLMREADTPHYPDPCTGLNCPTTTYLQDWIKFREDPTRTCDEQTLAPLQDAHFDASHGVSASIPIDAFVYANSSYQTPSNLDDVERQTAANGDLLTAGLNLCMAQRLRQLSPGGSSGELLLLPASDQRYLLEVIRERAQISMLQYAELGVVFAHKFIGPTYGATTPDALAQKQTIKETTLPDLEYWAENPTCLSSTGNHTACPGHLAAMGGDFAAAVQMDVQTSEELSQLLARSSSAREPRGGSPATPADETWGAGSWHQRLMAEMFGGDPLAIKSGGPWQHPLDQVRPGLRPGEDWPDKQQQPYYVTPISEPEVTDLWALARRYDRVGLVRQNILGCADPYSVELTAQYIYEYVEAELRKDACWKSSAPNCPTDIEQLKPDVTSANFDPSDTLLWKDYRITYAHAQTLAKHLLEALHPPPLNGCGDYRNDTRQGPQNVLGSFTIDPNYPSSTSQAELVSPDTVLADPPLQDAAPKYTRFAPYDWLPDAYLFAPLGSSAEQGFHGVGCYPSCVTPMTESKRLMGTISALAATRTMVEQSIAYLNDSSTAAPQQNPARLTDYFAEAPKILSLISGAVGDSGVVVKTLTVKDPQSESMLPVATGTGANQRYWWLLQGTYDPKDAFWQQGGTYQVCAVEDPYAGDVFANPTKTTWDNTADDVYNALPSGSCQPMQLISDASATPRWVGYVDTPPTYPIYSTLVAVRTDGGTNQYELLGSEFELRGSEITSNVLATGGALGAFVHQQLQLDSTDPVLPKYDGFGLPTRWVPPLDAGLIGGTPGDPSSDHYLDLAKQAADDATTAVNQAADDLQQQQKSEADQIAAVAKAQEGLKEASETLCGSGNASCNVTLTKTTPKPAWYPGHPTKPQPPIDCQTVLANINDSDVNNALDCIAYKVFNEFTTTQVSVADPVAKHMQDPAAPAFEEYAGGDIQAALIEQWGALRAPAEKFRALVAAKNSVEAQNNAAFYAVLNVDVQIDNACGASGRARGIASGISFSWPPGFSFGPIIAEQERCESLKSQLSNAQQQVIETQDQAFAALVSAIQGTVAAETAIALSGAKVESIVNKSHLATARYNLESSLAAAGNTTSTGLYREYRAYDMWRAHALLDNARRYALAARRSMEARYVVDLSTLNKPEAFVASPATWADEVYSYDLSLPAAVGLAVGQAQQGAIYPNKVSDYVGNLQAFEAGYAVTRPTAVASDELDVVTLPGLQGTATGVNADGNVCDPATDSSCTPSEWHRGDWLVHCPDTDTWQGIDPKLSSANDACGVGATKAASPPDRIKLEFTLDPWGRLDHHIANPPYQNRFNGRWDRLAVNIVGTGVKDCSLAADPSGCYSQAFIPFSLTHVGPAWVTDYDGIWHQQDLPPGKIEAGKALAAELWLDPLKDGWSTSYISAVARTEFAFRPLGGAYELELEVGPEVNLDRIERIQLLLGSHYWVKQN